MPGSDLVRAALPEYRNSVPYRGDIPVLVADKADPGGWLRADPVGPAGGDTGRWPAADGDGLSFTARDAGLLNGKRVTVHLLPYYAMRHQRYVVYWKLYSPGEFASRRATVSDEVDPADAADEKRHHVEGEHTDTSSIKDNRHFWENNRPGRFATDGGWFSYDLQPARSEHDSSGQWLVVTYWGSTPEGHSFDILVNGELLTTETLPDDAGMRYYERAYRLPMMPRQNKSPFVITFRARPGQTAGPVYGLRLTTNPRAFPHYLFY